MKKRNLIAGLFLPVSAALIAAPLTPEQALSRVENDHHVMTRSSVAPKLSMAVGTNTFDNALYLFSYEGNNGYIVVSADDSVVPLLGYSTSGNIDPENLSPTFQWWLDEYAKQIEYMAKNPVKTQLPSTRAVDDFAPIAPMIKTQWNQGEPYNNQCPKYGWMTPPTGCVATSMAQVMKYYEYPEVGTGKIAYMPGFEVGALSLDFSKNPFDWANMLDNYDTTEYTKEQADAVAYLMKACGYGCRMDYGPSESGAQTYDQALAFVQYFKYDKSLDYIFRQNYTYDGWKQVIYDNLAAGHPVIYGGVGPSLGGHSFVCDGYGSDGYFHFNWGWSGLSDGYFLLDTLTPEVQGIGGNIGGFSFGQNALVNIFPAVSEDSLPPLPSLTQTGSTIGRMNGDTLLLGVEGATWFTLGWYNLTYYPYTYTIGLKLEKEGEDSTPLYINEESVVELPKNQFTGWAYYPNNIQSSLYFDLKGLELTNGVYKATVVNKVMELPEYGWMDITVNNGFYNYLYLVKDENGITIKEMEYADVIVEDFQVLSSMYYMTPVKVKAIITNPSDVQLTKSLGVDAIWYNDATHNYENPFTSDSFVYSINPGETREIVWDLVFNENSGIVLNEPIELDLYLMNFYDYDYYDAAPATAIMYPTPAILDAVCDININGAVESDNMWVVPFSEPVGVNISINVQDGVLYEAMRMSLWDMTETPELISYETYSGFAFVYPEESLNFTYDLYVPEQDDNKLYVFRIDYMNPLTGEYEEFASTPYIRFDSTLGVNSIFADDTDSIIIRGYKNNGCLVEAQSGIASVIISTIDGVSYVPQFVKGATSLSIPAEELSANLVIVTVTDINGHIKSVKLKR